MRHLTFNVAGVTFRRREALGLVMMAAERPLRARLVAEPDNPHDKHAIRVEATTDEAVQPWEHVGYVPAADAAQVSTLLAKGPVTVKVEGYGRLKRDDMTPWFRLSLEYTVAGKRSSAAAMSDLSTTLRAAKDIMDLVAVGKQVSERRHELLPSDLAQLRILYSQRVREMERQRAFERDQG